MQANLNGLRNKTEGDWFWINRIVIQEYAVRIGVISLGVYHLLSCMADAKQCCFPSQNYMAEKLGCSRSSVNRAIKILREHNLIRVERKKRQCFYHLLKVKNALENSKMSTKDTGDVSTIHTNDNQLNKINANAMYAIEPMDIESQNKEKPESKYERIAHFLADALHDPQHLPLYYHFAKTHPESVLRKILAHVKETPIYKIRKSRGAFFTYLVNHYDENRE